jgi:hypothetical protein
MVTPGGARSENRDAVVSVRAATRKIVEKNVGSLTKS